MYRIPLIIRKLYRKVSLKEIKQLQFKCEKSLAWFCWDHVEDEMPITWCEAHEAAVVIMEEADDFEFLKSSAE